MKIKSTVSADDAEVSMLHDMVSSICLVVYPSVEEQALAVLESKLHFKKALDELLSTALEKGMERRKETPDNIHIDIPIVM